MKHTLYTLLFLTLGCAWVLDHARASEVTPLISKPIPPATEREGLMVRVVLAPGEDSPAHRHNAHTFVYVLEGSVAMAVNGEEEVILRAGETFYEAPSDVHTTSRNLDAEKEAVLLVFFVKEPEAPPTVPVSR
jgi:Uncharacterized conserved protein, contains double-stranded beta-helix domain